MDKYEKKLMFKLSPELSDGDHWIIAENTEAVLEAVKSWCEYLPYHGEGESFTVATIMRSQAEVEAPPDI